MHIRTLITLATLLIFNGAVAPVAESAGVGGYVESSGYTGSVSGNFGSNNVSGGRVGFGLAYDSNPNGDGVFNNRLDVGYVHTWASDTVAPGRSDSFDVDYEMNGLSINNAFGFGVVRRENFRLWLGPAIGLGLDFLDTDAGSAKVLSIGGGPQIGMNFKVSERFLIALTAAYQYRYRYELVDVPRVEDADGGTSYGFANIAFLYNTGQ